MSGVLTYDQRRDEEQLEVHRGAIDLFIADYKRRRPPAGARRQTLFFFPGGMACQLKRTKTAFEEGNSNAEFDYELLWLNCGTFFGNAKKLGMEKDAEDIFRDKGNRIIVADGAVHLGKHTPHDGLIDWCADNNVDLFVFNWDWRREQEVCASFFVKQFWPVFADSVARAGIPEAARNFSLLGHSFGGMIVKLILEGDDADVSRKLRYAVTAATPFYGYVGQVHRWFEGEPLLNGDGHVVRDDIIRVLSSMPGLYILNFLDKATYATVEDALAADEFGIPDYPSKDADTDAPFDPWSQQSSSNGKKVRYPENMGFLSAELGRALQTYRKVAKSTKDKRFFNIRGVRLKRGENNARAETVGSVKCGWIANPFDPEEDSPVHDGANLPGDGTQPAWTARLVSPDKNRCRTVKGEDLTHMFAMSDAGVLRELASILLGPEARLTSVVRPRPEPTFATDEELDEFLHAIYDYQKQAHETMPSEEEIQQALPANVKKNMPRIARRIIEDILKRPPGARR